MATDEPIETVDLDEVARLERVIAEREAEEKLQPPVRKPVDTTLMSTHEAIDEARAAREHPRELRVPPAPLVPFISAEAVDQRLQAVSQQMQQIEAQTRHTMLLVMILADRSRITAEEYNTAIQKTQQAEAAARKEP